MKLKMNLESITDPQKKLAHIFALIILFVGYFNHLFITEPIAIFFRFSSFTGQILVSKFLSLCNWTYEIIRVTCLFLQILYEDTVVFLNDATEKFSLTIYLLKLFYMFVEDLVSNIAWTFCQILEGFISFLKFLLDTAGTVKEGISLTGLSIWHFFTNLPQILVSTVLGINVLFKNTLNEISAVIFLLVEYAIDSYNKFYLVLYDIPLDSVYGLIIGAVLITIVCVKFKAICHFLSKLFSNILTGITSFGVSLWSGRFLEQNRRFHDNPDDDGMRCIVCLYHIKEVIIFPCKHLCLCQGCSKLLSKNHPVCPICRSDITNTLKVYI